MNLKIRYKLFISILLSVILVVVAYQIFAGLNGTLRCSLKPTFKNQDRYVPFMNQTYQDDSYEIFSVYRDEIGYLYSYQNPNKFRFTFLEYKTSKKNIINYKDNSDSELFMIDDRYASNSYGRNPEVKYISRPCPEFSNETYIQLAGDYSIDTVLNNKFYRFVGNISNISIISQSEKQFEFQLESNYTELNIFQRDNRINIYFVEELGSEYNKHATTDYFSQDMINIYVNND
jgi:hypothetical protein